MLSPLSSRRRRELILLILPLLLFSCAGSKPPPESVEKLSAVKFNLAPGEEIKFANGDRIIGITRDSVLHVPKPEKAERKPLINIQTSIVKDKSKVNSENKDKSKVKEAKRVDKSNVNSGNKDKSLENSKNRHKEKSGGLPWWLWLIIILAILIWIFWKGIKAWIKTQFPFL